MSLNFFSGEINNFNNDKDIFKRKKNLLKKNLYGNTLFNRITFDYFLN